VRVPVTFHSKHHASSYAPAIAWRDLPRSTRLVFWTGLTAAVATLSVFIFLLWAGLQIEG